MRRPQFIARQGGCPSGWVGRVVAEIMARETTAENAIALRHLDPQQSDAILEIGFGHGRVIADLARLCPMGRVCGIDTSATMLKMASQRNRKAIAGGLVRLDLGDSASLPYPSQSFDRAVSVHTLYFWPEPLDHLREIQRVLKPGGRLVLGFKPDSGEARRSLSAVHLHVSNSGESA
jgi:ubiquinone/menaquinone biosynthesis C-methylase UbiE